MASNLTSTLSPYDLTLVITQGDLTHVVTGFMEDQIVTIDQQMPRFELYTGADNTTTRIHKNNTSATVTLHLQQASNSNDILSLLLQRDLETRDSSGMFNFTIKDNSGRSLYHALEAYIANVPNASHGTTMQSREWVIHTPKMTTYVGGNAKMDSADQASVTTLGSTVDARWRA